MPSSITTHTSLSWSTEKSGRLIGLTLSIMMENHEADRTCTYSEDQSEARTCTTVTAILLASVPVQGTAYLGAVYLQELEIDRELILG